jgi:ribosomal protein L37E
VHVKLKREARNMLLATSSPTWPTELAALEEMIEPSGPPSCVECSKLIVEHKRTAGVWLFHREGVRVAERGSVAVRVPTHATDHTAAFMTAIERNGKVEHPPGGPASWTALPAGWHRWYAHTFHQETLAQCQVHPRTPANRGTEHWPCEACGNTASGATEKKRGVMRCNDCGYPQASKVRG